MVSQIFCWPPPWPPVCCLISRSSSFNWHIQQITFSQQNFKRFEDFLATVLTIFLSLLGLIGLIIANQSSLQRKITVKEIHLCCPSYVFPWPRVPPPVFFILESPLAPSAIVDSFAMVSFFYWKTLHSVILLWTHKLNLSLLKVMFLSRWLLYWVW